MNILFVNNTIENCGVHQYGQNTAHLLSNSTKFNFIYVECGNKEALLNQVDEHEPKAIIYNYHGATLHCFDHLLPQQLSHIKHLALYHEFGIPSHIFNMVISQDPSEPEIGNLRTTPRLIFPYENNHPYHPVPIIGSFGFAFDVKGFDTLVHKANQDLDEAIVKLHMPSSHYGDPGGNLAQQMIKRCQDIAKPGIVVEGSFGFLTRDELVDWLGYNTLNVFMYAELPGRGISGVLDFALSSLRPIGITHSDMFRHIHPYNLPIYVEDENLRMLIETDIKRYEKVFEDWNYHKLVEKYEQILEEVLKG